MQTEEEATESWKETGADPPMPRPRTKRGDCKLQPGHPVPHNAGEENTVEGEPGVVQDSPLAESQPPETVVAGEREEAAETGAKELEGAAEELTLGGEQSDSMDEMGGELLDSSLISSLIANPQARKNYIRWSK
ncbi:UNVERIFIED_CONTAM: hypothetical protein FKN15_045548 [Acipenser sinensis]